MSFRKRITANFLWLLLSELVGRGAIIIGGIYLSRVLGVESYGLFVLAQSTIQGFWLAVDMGSGLYGVREIARNPEQAARVINPLLTMRITFGIAIYGLLVLVVWGLPAMGASWQGTVLDGPLAMVLLAAGLYLIIYSFYPDWILKGLEGFRELPYGRVLAALLFIVGIVSWVEGPEGLVLAGSIWALSYLAGSGLLFYRLVKTTGYRFRPDWRLPVWWGHLRESIFYSLSSLLMMAYNYLPLLLIMGWHSETILGLFAAPFRIILAIGSAGYLLATAFFPSMARLYQQDRPQLVRRYRALRWLLLIAGCAVAIIGSLMAEPVVLTLFGQAYRESVAVFAVAIWLVPIMFARFSNGSLLQATGYQRSHNVASATGAVGSLLFGLWLIPLWGAVGAAWSLLGAELMMSVAMYLSVRKHILNPTLKRVEEGV
uniref:Putative Membrane protein involved in the export of O-antigen and teichoic acid n=1 Tax=Magnetococcus massalia (strain MO-1) TaxID=451514 RepID=A0A1S7LLA5_MAGMO|nr:putative Membrane protein involved in the export of O-antigen and teichoic acid [Candidatus Magnetococcus massalia]